MTAPALSVASLECGHCGDVAIYGDRRGLFTDGDGERCITCGFPGHVVVDEDLCGDDEHDNHASWSCSDGNDDVCKRADCDECIEVRASFGLPALRVGEEGDAKR